MPAEASFARGRALLAGRLAPEPAAATTSGEDGAFRLRAEAGMWRLRLEAEGHVPMEHWLNPLLWPLILPDAGLRAAVPVEVQVTGPDGEPVAGAWVMVTPADRSFWRRGRRDSWQPGRRLARTGHRGRARLPRAEGETLQVRVAAAGYPEPEPVEASARRVEVTLAAGVGREVEVRSPAGAPLAGVLVRAGASAFPVGWTGDDGRLTVIAPAEGELAVMAESEDGRRGRTRLSASPEEPGAPAILELDPQLTLSGRVIDASRRQPIAGALVWSTDPALHVQSDPDGRFEVPAEEVGDGTLWLQAAAPGHFQAFTRSRRGEARTTLALEPAAAVRGRVVDTAGEAVEGATVRALPAPDGGRMRYTHGMEAVAAITDADGRFQVAPLRPQLSYRVTAAKPGYAPAEQRVAGEPGREELRLVLTAGRTAVGRVVDAGGSPVAEAVVELTASVESSSPRAYFFRMRDQFVETREAFTGADGRFEIGDLPSGRFDLTAAAPGFAKASLPGLEIPEGHGEHDLGRVVLEPGVAIEGRVTDADGRPLEGAAVRLVSDDPMSMLRMRMRGEMLEPVATTGADGWFRVEDRRPGEVVELFVALEGFADRTVSAVEVPTTEPLRIELHPASKVSGRVVDQGGRPVSEASVMAQVVASGSAFGATFQSTMARGHDSTDEQGEFELEGLEPGSVRLVVHAEGWKQTELGNLEISPGKDLTDLEIVLERGASISGRVIGPDGRPVIGAHLMVEQGASTQGGGPTDGDGGYRIDGVETGWKTVTVHDDELPMLSKEVEVRPGDNRLDLVYEPGVEVSGRLVDGQGAPVAGAHLQLNQPGTRYGSARARSGSDGGFAFDHVTPGSYRLGVEVQGSSSRVLEDPIEVGDAPVSGLLVELPPDLAIVGRIVGLEPGEMGGVEIWARSLGDRGFGRGQARHDGSYRISGLSSGDWLVTAEHALRGGQASARVTIQPGAPETVADLEFGGGLTLGGRLFQGDQPLGGAHLWVRGSDVSGHGNARSNADGRFEISGLEPGNYVLSVSGPTGTMLHRRQVELLSDLEIDIAIRTARVSGHVLDASSSEPISGASIWVEAPAAVGTDDPFSYLRERVSSDARGYFHLSALAEGAYRIKAEKPGYAPGELSVVVEPGIDREGLEILLGATQGLALQVRHAGGRPARMVLAVLTDAAGRPVAGGRYSATEGGVVRMTSAPPGSWELLVMADASAPATLPVTVPGELVPVLLVPGARLRIEVPDLADEATLATATVYGSDGRLFRTILWRDRLREKWSVSYGQAVVDGLPAGTWRVVVTASDGRTWEGIATVAPGQTSGLTLP